MSLNKSAQVYVICPTAATGTAAVEVITYVTSAAAAGVARVVLAGRTIEASVASGDSVTVIAAAVAAAINNQTDLPVTATSALGVVTCTARVMGSEFLSLRIRAQMIGTGITTTVSPTSDIQFGSSGVGAAVVGAGAISYTAALATIAGTDYDYIVPCVQLDAPLDALMAQVNTLAEPSTGFRQKVVVGTCLTPSAATTLALSQNQARERICNSEENPEPCWLVGATCAAVMSKNEVSDPAFNFDSFGTKTGQAFPLQRPYNDSAIPTTTEIKSMLNNGITAIGVSQGGQPYIVRSVTSYHKNGANFDYRVRDSSVVTVADAHTDNLVASLASSPWTKITTDPANPSKQPRAEFATPNRVKAAVESEVNSSVDRGWLDPGKLDTMIAAIQCGADPTVTSRMNISNPIYSAVMLHQHALLVKESSASA
jgi:phage tail sheath gpL-like